MDWKRPGYLAPRHRKYLSGEYDFEDHSNQSAFRSEVRKRLAGKIQDDALIEYGLNEGILSKDDVMEPNVERALQLNQGKPATELPMTDEAIEQNQGAAKAQAESVGLETGKIEGVMEDMQSEILQMRNEVKKSDQHRQEKLLNEIKERMHTMFATVYIEFAETLINDQSDGCDEKEIVTALIEGTWPDQKHMLRIADRELSEN